MSPSRPITFSQGKVSYVSQDARCVPPVLGKLYGEKAHSLDLSYNQLSSLDGVQSFTHLTELIVDNNELNDGLEIPVLPALHTLSLNNNKITNIDMLVKQIKTRLKNLEYLSLLGNIACPNQLSDANKDEDDYQRYRYFVLHHLPGLKFLDSRPVREDEWREGRRVGHLMRVARPTNNTYRLSPEREPTFRFTPLPVSKTSRGPHGIYGKCIYRYTGKHSEGNRFIRNHQL